MGTLVEHLFFNSTHSLDVYTIIFHVGLHVHGKRSNSMFLKGSQNRAVPLLPFVLIVLAKSWKMVVPAEKLPIVAFFKENFA